LCDVLKTLIAASLKFFLNLENQTIFCFLIQIQSTMAFLII